MVLLPYRLDCHVCVCMYGMYVCDFCSFFGPSCLPSSSASLARNAMSSTFNHEEKIAMLRSILKQVEFCGSKLAPMESRQCDSDARGTDAARMAELWTHGEHANMSDAAVSSLARSMVARASYHGTSYANIFRDKDPW